MRFLVANATNYIRNLLYHFSYIAVTVTTLIVVVLTNFVYFLRNVFTLYNNIIGSEKMLFCTIN